MANPQDPQMCVESFEKLVAPVHSLMPYTSLIWIPSAPKYDRVSVVIGAAPVNPNLQH